MTTILTEARLDSQSKVVEMLREGQVQMESSIQGAGHQYANTRLKSRYTPAGYIEEQMSGISKLDTIKALLKQAEEDWPSLLKRLENIRETILNKSTCRNGMVLNLTGDKVVLETVQPSVEEFLQNIPGESNGEKLQDFYSTEHPWVTAARAKMTATPEDEGFVVPTQVSYVGKGGLLFQPGDINEGSNAVVSRYLRTGYLWDQVRVIGGAYGGFCTFTGFDGYFSFLSYRDPNLSKTLDVYDAAADNLLAASEALAEDPEALATAIIGAVGDMDAAHSPDQKGWISLQRYMTNEKPERRQEFRDQVLGTTVDDFRKFAEQLKGLNERASVAVVSSKAAFEAAAEDGKEMVMKEVV